MFKILRYDVSDEGYTDANLLDAKKLIGIRLCIGDSLITQFPDGIRINIESPNEPNDYFVAGHMPVISTRAKEIFVQNSANVEYLPIDLTLADGTKPKTPYFYPNILDIVDCLDWKASKYTKEKNYATKIKSIAFREDTSINSPLFLVARAIPYIICVTTDIGLALSKAGCQGINLVSAADWTNIAYPS
jgi:hypothetical protein